MQYKGQITGQGTWEPIVSTADYYAVNNLLSDPKRRTTTGNTRKHLLPGLAKCGRCGAGMRSGWVGTRSGGRSYLYRCPSCSMDEAPQAAGAGGIKTSQLLVMNAAFEKHLQALDSRSLGSTKTRVLRGPLGGPRRASAMGELTLSRKRAVIDALLDVTVLPVGKDSDGKALHEGIRISVKADTEGAVCQDWLDWITPQTAVIRFDALRNAEEAMTSAQEKAIVPAFAVTDRNVA